MGTFLIKQNAGNGLGVDHWWRPYDYVKHSYVCSDTRLKGMRYSGPQLTFTCLHHLSRVDETFNLERTNVSAKLRKYSKPLVPESHWWAFVLVSSFVALMLQGRRGPWEVPLRPKCLERKLCLAYVSCLFLWSPSHGTPLAPSPVASRGQVGFF